MTDRSPIRVLIADDQNMIRTGGNGMVQLTYDVQ